MNGSPTNEPFVGRFCRALSRTPRAGHPRDLKTAALAAHHLLLSHGLAVQAIRASAPRPVQVGIVLNLNPVHPASDSEADQLAARKYDAVLNRLFLDPVFKAVYPQDLVALLPGAFPADAESDLKIIAEPLDFMGVNYYTRSVICHDPAEPPLHLSWVNPAGSEYSQMWEIYPPGLYEILTRVWEEYRPARMWVSEKRHPVPDGVDFDGRVRDIRRIAYYRDHLVQVHRAISDGVPIGHLTWPGRCWTTSSGRTATRCASDWSTFDFEDPGAHHQRQRTLVCRGDSQQRTENRITPPMNTIHIVSHTHWDREWYLPFQQFRLRLVHLIDNLFAIFDREPEYRYFMLDGQAIVLEDYLAMRPEMSERIRQAVQSGRLVDRSLVHPADEFLVSRKRPSATCCTANRSPGSSASA